MTTVIDPAGSPTIVYNRGGTTVTALNSAGTGQSTATPIVRYSGVTVAVVTSTSSPTGQGVVLPDDPEIGDVVEVYHAGHVSGSYGPFHVYPPSGWSVGDQAINSPVGIDSNGARFRYLGSSLYGAVIST